MAGPTLLAQANAPHRTPGTSPNIIPVIKPLSQQAITIYLDGSTKLDLSAIVNENITLVHLGERLIILFDNNAEVTLDSFFGVNGQPLGDVTVGLGAGRGPPSGFRLTAKSARVGYGSAPSA